MVSKNAAGKTVSLLCKAPQHLATLLGKEQSVEALGIGFNLNITYGLMLRSTPNLSTLVLGQHVDSDAWGVLLSNANLKSALCSLTLLWPIDKKRLTQIVSSFTQVAHLDIRLPEADALTDQCVAETLAWLPSIKSISICGKQHNGPNRPASIIDNILGNQLISWTLRRAKFTHVEGPATKGDRNMVEDGRCHRSSIKSLVLKECGRIEHIMPVILPLLTGQHLKCLEVDRLVFVSFICCCHCGYKQAGQLACRLKINIIILQLSKVIELNFIFLLQL